MSLRYLVERSSRHYGPLTAVTCGQTSYSYSEVAERSLRLASMLRSHGCRQGDRVVVCLPNCAEYLEVELGIGLAGLVKVALNVRLPEDDLAAIAADAGAAAVIYSHELGAAAERIAGVLTEPALAFALEDRPHLRYERLGGDVTTHEDDLFALFYTSGTTGRPKGVMHTHHAQLNVALNLLLEFGPVRAGEQILLVQPLSHGGGFFMLPWFLSGGTCVVTRGFDAAESAELIARRGIETFKLVPTMLIRLLEAGVAPRDVPSLRKVIYGASPMPSDRIKEAVARFGPIFTQLYGQAEAPMCITVLPEADHAGDEPRVLSSAGRPWRNVEVRVVDGDYREVAPEETGEVIVRGEHMMSGYWGLPDETARVLRDGYIWTRDRATVDERGYVYLLGRTDEMILSGGFNIAPRAVEEVIDAHPSVLESAVVGVPDPEWGQRVKAYVTLKAGADAGADELLDFCGPRLGFQKPRAIEIVDALPRNAYGKVVKSELLAREEATP
jgi:long-chain acyl-CoA synthetase